MLRGIARGEALAELRRILTAGPLDALNTGDYAPANLEALLDALA